MPDEGRTRFISVTLWLRVLVFSRNQGSDLFRLPFSHI